MCCFLKSTVSSFVLLTFTIRLISEHQGTSCSPSSPWDDSSLSESRHITTISRLYYTVMDEQSTEECRGGGELWGELPELLTGEGVQHPVAECTIQSHIQFTSETCGRPTICDPAITNNKNSHYQRQYNISTNVVMQYFIAVVYFLLLGLCLFPSLYFYFLLVLICWFPCWVDCLHGSL